MKSLRSAGRRAGCARRGEELRRALERGRVGEDREAGRAARLIGAGQRRRVEVGADQALGGARLLDLGDQRPIRLRRAWHRAPGESRAPAGAALARASRSASGMAALAAPLPRACRRRSCREWWPSAVRDLDERCRARASAAPLSIAFARRATPCFSVAGLPPRARRAGRHHRRIAVGRGLPASTWRSASALCAASPPFRSRERGARQPASSGVISKLVTLPSFSSRHPGGAGRHDLVHAAFAMADPAGFAAEVAPAPAPAARPMLREARRSPGASRPPGWRGGRAG